MYINKFTVSSYYNKSFMHSIEANITPSEKLKLVDFFWSV